MVRDGAHAEYVVVPTESLSRKPGKLSMEQAAAIGVPFITAWTALRRAAQLEAGETLLIVGAAGAVGSAATQVANWRGARVLGADRRPERVIGAEAVIDVTKEDLRERVLASTGGKGADAVFDTVGGPMFEPALHSLRIGGRQVAITSVGDPRVSFNLLDFYHNLSRLIGVDTNKLTPRDVANILDELRPGFESGHLKAPAIELVSLVQAVTAYEMAASGKALAKQIIAIS